MKITFLGSGPTKPVMGKEKDKRRNSSLLIITRNKKNILIDCTPHFYEQMQTFANDVDRIDYVCFTHGHRDAVGGIAQLKHWLEEKKQEKKPIAFMEKETEDRIKEDFKDISHLEVKHFKPYHILDLEGLRIVPFRVNHAEVFPTGSRYPCVGYRIDNRLIYAEDMESVPEKSIPYFDKSFLIIIDAAMWFEREIRGHMNVETALNFAKKFRTRKIILTQAGHTYPNYNRALKEILEYWKKIKSESRIDVELSYDGMIIDIPDYFSKISEFMIEVRDGIYLPKPHAEWVWEGRKKCIIRAKKYSGMVGKLLYVVDNENAYGIIKLKRPLLISLKQFNEFKALHLVSDEERKKWWGNKKYLFLYSYDMVQKFKEPRKIKVKVGTQTFVKDIKFLEELATLELIQDVADYDPSNINNKQLADDWRIVCAWYATKKRNGDIKFSLETIVNIAKLIYDEIIQRVKRGDMKHEFQPENMTTLSKELYDAVSKDKIIEAGEKTEEELKKEGNIEYIVKIDEIKDILKEFKDFSIIDNFISIVGSTVKRKPGHEPNDIDLHIRLKEPSDYVKRAIEVRLLKSLPENIAKKIHFVWGDPEGSHDTFIPLYNLSVSRKEPEVIKMQDTTLQEDLMYLGDKFKDKFTINVNAIGTIDCDSVKGCIGYCYGGECYAWLTATRYGWDYSKPQIRYFEDSEIPKFIEQIQKASKESGRSFARIGVMGEPSLSWSNTVRIAKLIKDSGLKPVVITKHRKKATDDQFKQLIDVGTILHTSLSAVDGDLIYERLKEAERYHKLGGKSILRAVTCKLGNNEDIQRQDFILKQKLPILETPLRVSNENPMVKSGRILNPNNTVEFTDKVCKEDNKTCYSCKQQCGINWKLYEELSDTTSAQNPQVQATVWVVGKKVKVRDRVGRIREVKPQKTYIIEFDDGTTEIAKEEEMLSDDFVAMKTFLPLKSTATYNKSLFYDLNKTINSLNPSEENKYFVEEKLDGFRGVLHKKRNEIKIFSDQANEITKAFPTIVEQAKELTPEDIILDGEIVPYEKGESLGRRGLMKFIGAIKSGKKLDDSMIKFHIFDILYYKSQSLHDARLYERKKVLNLLKFGKNIIQVPYVVVNDKKQLEKAIKMFRALPKSEGAMIKNYNSIYPVPKQTDDWIKFRNVKNIHVKVLKIFSVKGANAWRYESGIEIPGNKIKEFDSKHIVEFEGKSYMSFGNTFNTSIKIKIGDMIDVAVQEIWKHVGKNGIRYSWHKPNVRHESERKETSTIEDLDAIVDAVGILVKESEEIEFEEIKKEFKAMDEPTRSEYSSEFWKKHWWKSFPKTGLGEFAYHHHWRGLPEEEINKKESELLFTDHSVHGDLRMQFNPLTLFGFTIFLGKTKDLRDGRDLGTLKEPDKLQGAWKLWQPKAWVDIGKEKPYISKPAGVGATTKKYAKFFAEDWGTYEIGVWREHSFEIFLNGKILKGRYLIVYAPVGQGRKWLIGKPQDQTPYAEKNKLSDVVKELKEKRQKWLIWNKPGKKPMLIDIEKGG